MSVTRTYKPLIELPGVKIVSCSAVLPNRMQCWRSGDVQVTETASTTAEDGTVTDKVSVYQLCRRHALIQKEADKVSVYQLCRRHALIQKEADARAQSALVADEAKVAADEAKVKAEPDETVSD